MLVIDQFEELFTLVDDETIRQRFLANLVTAVTEPHGRVKVVLTLRADLYDKPLQYPEFGALLSGSVVNVTPLSTEELEVAALQPATKAGVSFEPGLLSQLIFDVGNQPGSLPLFQYTLTELFDRRSDDTLMADTYQAMGGVSGALSRRAGELYDELDPQQQEAARQLFLRLVTVTGEGERSRRRVSAGEIVSLEADVVTMQEVIEQFGRHRLLAFDAEPSTGAPTIEVAHEALLVVWDQFHAWIDQHEGDLHRLSSLRAAVSEWERAGEHPDYLLAGSRLSEFEQWRASNRITLTAVEQRFLDASADRRRGEEEAEARRQKRELRRLRVTLVAVLIVLAGALGAGAFAFIQRSRADEAATQSRPGAWPPRPPRRSTPTGASLCCSPRRHTSGSRVRRLWVRSNRSCRRPARSWATSRATPPTTPWSGRSRGMPSSLLVPMASTSSMSSRSTGSNASRWFPTCSSPPVAGGWPRSTSATMAGSWRQPPRSEAWS